jgi:hypothetical protein
MLLLGVGSEGGFDDRNGKLLKVLNDMIQTCNFYSFSTWQLVPNIRGNLEPAASRSAPSKSRICSQLKRSLRMLPSS